MTVFKQPSCYINHYVLHFINYILPAVHNYFHLVEVSFAFPGKLKVLYVQVFFNIIYIKLQC